MEINKDRLRVYIASPLGADTPEGIMKNVNKATDAFFRLFRLGFSPFCPHLSVFSGGCFKEERESAHGTVITRILSEVDYTPGETSWADWIAIDLPWVAASDAVLRLPGPSKGADEETKHAAKCGVPVFYTEDALVLWKKTIEENQ